MPHGISAVSALSTLGRAVDQWLLPPKVSQLLRHRYRSLRRSRYYGLELLDQKIERYVDYERGFFVELGANDGLSQSNTAYFEKHRGWRGILIEPIPQKYLECRKNRSPDNCIVCAACVAFGYPQEFVPMLYSNLMTTPLCPSNIEDPVDHARSGKKFLAETEDNFVFGARAMTLDQILKECRAPNTIDLLSIDVEGAELGVLKGIDFAEFEIRNIVIESRDIGSIMELLRIHGYGSVHELSHHDYLITKAP